MSSREAAHPVFASDVVQAVRAVGGWARLEDWGVVTVCGPDAAALLQNQTTNDVMALAVGEGQASALLDRKAHIQALFTLVRFSENDFWLVSDASQAATIAAHLENFHFTEDLVISNVSDDWCYFALQGPQSVRVLTGWECVYPSRDYEITRLAFGGGYLGWLLNTPLTGEIGVVMGIHPSQAFPFEAILSDLSWPQITPDTFKMLQIEAGLAVFGREITPDLMLPQTGQEQSRVSYTKGCYPGQEVVAKIKNFGGVQKALVGLCFDAFLIQDPCTTPTPLLLDNQTVGTLCSITYSPTLVRVIGLAYLDRALRNPGSQLSFQIWDRDYNATVVSLPFYQAESSGKTAIARYESALEQFAHDRDDEAVMLLKEALALDPNLTDAYESLGVILGRQGKLDEAIILMQRLAELDPEAVMPHTNLSVFYMQKGLKEEAETEKAIATTLGFKKAIADSQQKHSAQTAQAEKRQALAQKIAMFNEVLEIDAEDALAQYGLGSAYNELGQYARAVNHLEKAIVLNPRQSVAYLALATALIQTGNKDKARETLESGIAVASQRGDLMPMQSMQSQLAQL